jgi:lipid-A-disaccharide synthase
LIPIYKQTIQLLSTKINKLHITIPTLECYKARLEKENWGCPVTVITNFKDRKDAYAASKVALAASGTIALELAAANLPMVITYKISKISEWIVCTFIKIKYACMINILLKKSIVPELLQEDCNPETLSQAVLGLLKDSKQQEQALGQIRDLLTPKNSKPSDLAAEAIFKVLKRTE